LLFIGTAFHYKGGVETLRAFKRLQPRLPVRLTVVSYVPPDVKREFATVPGLTFGSRLPPSELEALFQVSDLLVAPFHSDTYGFVLLEAFAHGIPCIVTNQFAMPEIVRDGVTGLVVDNHLSRFGSDRLPRMSPFDDDSAVRARLADPPDWYVDQLTSAIETLVTSRATRLAMSEAAFQEVTYGRFSVDRRRRAMAEVYGP
jgi:glycosyltransferase involved in cell wall biosynthesis